MSVRSWWLGIVEPSADGEPDRVERDLKAERRQTATRAAELREESAAIREHSLELIKRALPVLERSQLLKERAENRGTGDGTVESPRKAS